MIAPPPVLFPDLKNSRWAKVDLNALYAKQHYGFPIISQCNDPEYCTSWVNDIARALGVDYTYGGYMEDRSYLWAGHYHDPSRMRHLGIDYNVPAGTRVYYPFDVAAATVMHVLRDKDQDGGWGGRVIVRPHGVNHPWVIFAHLMHDYLPFEGDLLQRGSYIGTVATSSENGGWYPHLHLQCVAEELVFREGLDSIDGYGLNSEHDSESFPNPEDFM
jgi:hypothetical protein